MTGDAQPSDAADRFTSGFARCFAAADRKRMWPYRDTAPLVLLLLVFDSGSVAAQSAVLLSPDTLFYPTQSVVTITNVSGATTSIDSVAIGIGGPRAYDVELAMPDSTYGPHYLNPVIRTSFAVGSPLAPGDAALFRVLAFDPCTICSGGNGGFGPDTLLVYSAGSPVPETALLDLTHYVPTEPHPQAPSSLRMVAYPNPTSGNLTLGFGTILSANAYVVLHDASGRVVSSQLLRAGHAPELTIETRGLPAGIYHVRASTANGGSATVRFVLTR